MNQTGELMKMKTKNPFVFLRRFFLLAPSPLDGFPSLLPRLAAQIALRSTRWAAAEDWEAELRGRRGGGEGCFNWHSCLGMSDGSTTSQLAENNKPSL